MSDNWFNIVDRIIAGDMTAIDEVYLEKTKRASIANAAIETRDDLIAVASLHLSASKWTVVEESANAWVKRFQGR